MELTSEQIKLALQKLNLMKRFSLDDYVEATQTTLAKAKLQNIAISIAVLDIHATLAFFYREPESLLISLELAKKKAYSAYAMQCDTFTLSPLTQPGQNLYQLESMTNGTIVTFGGGVLLKNALGQILGAVGVSGAMDPHDDHNLAEIFKNKLLATS